MPSLKPSFTAAGWLGVPAIPVTRPTQENRPQEMEKLQAQVKKQSSQMQELLNSAEWREQLQIIREISEKCKEEVRTQLDSPEWQEQMRQAREQMHKMQEEMKSRFENAEWREQMRRLREEARKLASEVKTQEDKTAFLQSAEWQKQMQEVREMARKASEEANAYLKSPEWQSQMGKIREIQEMAAARARGCMDSPEWKEQMQRLEEMLKKIREDINRYAEPMGLQQTTKQPGTAGAIRDDGGGSVPMAHRVRSRRTGRRSASPRASGCLPYKPPAPFPTDTVGIGYGRTSCITCRAG